MSAQETRARLLDAAVEVFELKGYEGATVSLIAREAGLTTGAIYAHYSGKAELMLDAVARHGDRATAALFGPDGPGDVEHLLLVLGEYLLQRRPEESGLLLEAVLAGRRDPALAEVVSGALTQRSEFIGSLLADAQDRGELTTATPIPAAARFMLMLGLGSMLLRDLDLPAVDPDDWNTLIGRLVGTFTQDDFTQDNFTQGDTP